MNAAEALIQSFVGDRQPIDYLAGHANRGTPPRLRDNMRTVYFQGENIRASRGQRKRLARLLAISKTDEAVPLKHMHSARRQRAEAEIAAAAAAAPAKPARKPRAKKAPVAE